MGIAACMIAATPMDSSAQRRYHRERYYDHQRHHHMSHKAKGALIGAGSGAIIGGVAHGGKGALVGSAIGAGTGYLIGRHRQHHPHR